MLLQTGHFGRDGIVRTLAPILTESVPVFQVKSDFSRQRAEAR